MSERTLLDDPLHGQPILCNMEIRGALERITELLQNHVVDCDLSFHSIIPMPQEVSDSRSSKPVEYMKWVHQHWGGLLEDGTTDILVDNLSGAAKISFSTWWDTAIPVIQKLADMYPDLVVHHGYTGDSKSKTQNPHTELKRIHAMEHNQNTPQISAEYHSFLDNWRNLDARTRDVLNMDIMNNADRIVPYKDGPFDRYGLAHFDGVSYYPDDANFDGFMRSAVLCCEKTGETTLGEVLKNATSAEKMRIENDVLDWMSTNVNFPLPKTLGKRAENAVDDYRPYAINGLEHMVDAYYTSKDHPAYDLANAMLTVSLVYIHESLKESTAATKIARRFVFEKMGIAQQDDVRGDIESALRNAIKMEASFQKIRQLYPQLQEEAALAENAANKIKRVWQDIANRTSTVADQSAEKLESKTVRSTGVRP